MTSASPLSSAAFRVGGKGRVVVPAAVRRAAGIDQGAEVVARADGQGRMVIETVESIKARVLASAPEPSGLDVVADDSEAAGAALLAHLGL